VDGGASLRAGLDEAVAVSATTGTGLGDLLKAIAGRLGIAAPIEILLGPGDGRTRAYLYEIGAVLEETTREDGSAAILVRTDPAILERLGREARVLLQQGGALPKLSGLPDDAYHMEQV